MARKLLTTIYIIAIVLQGCLALPFLTATNNIEDNLLEQGLSNGRIDYNTVIGHFKEFFMYLPVMMSTVKDTMSGFPKFAEGIRILTANNNCGNGCRSNDDDCKCGSSRSRGGHVSNEIDG